MYDEPKKKTDNEALNQILEEVQGINKKVRLFYWLVIIGLILFIIWFYTKFVISKFRSRSILVWWFGLWSLIYNIGFF